MPKIYAINFVENLRSETQKAKLGIMVKSQPGAVFETDGVADFLTEEATELFGHSLRHRHRGHSSRLRAADLAPGEKIKY